MKPTEADLSIINSRLPGTTLAATSVEILPFRLFDNQITDRYTIMSPEMMKKLMKDANDGLIAMNAMHQSRYTLPVGRSVNGRITKNGAVSELQVKMYAVTTRPDGSPMEDGKDIADRYNTGAVYACSAGVQVGFYKCSICGNDIRDWQNCDHFPGETYTIDEKPVIATALMTGHDIQDGMAMDCGCYECSAVTAGGVRNASVLTETFGKYESGSDPKEFKKAQFEDKQISERITLMPYTAIIQKEDVSMDSSTKVLMDKNFELMEGKNKAELALTALQGEFNVFKVGAEAKVKQLDTITAEFALSKESLVTALASVEEFTKKATDLESLLASTKEEFELKVKTAEEAAAGALAFKEAYVAIVSADGIKIDREADYASKSLEELQTLHAEYLAEIAKLPAGQQSQGEQGEQGTVITHAYQGLDDAHFKTR